MQLQKKGKKADNGIGSVLDFLLANARLVLGVGGAAMLGIATLAVKRVRISMWRHDIGCSMEVFFCRPVPRENLDADSKSPAPYRNTFHEFIVKTASYKAEETNGLGPVITFIL